MNNKVIFLDFDGPMIPNRSYWYGGNLTDCGVVKTFDPVAVSMINYLLWESKAKLVISSTWRKQGYEVVSALISKQGIEPTHLHDDWRTDSLMLGWSGTAYRGHEVHDWLDRHPEVDTYVSIDDEPDLTRQIVKSKGRNPKAWIQVSMWDGISYKDFHRATEILGVNTAQGKSKYKRIMPV